MQRILVAAVTTALLMACGSGPTTGTGGGSGGGSGGGGSATGGGSGGGSATGGGSGGGSATGGGSGGGSATGGGSGGGGGSGTPLDITLNYQAQCPAVNPQCGGDLVGRWFYTAACVDNCLISPLQQSCPGATVSNVTGTTRGEVTFTNTTVSRNVTSTYTATVSVPAGCVAAGCALVEVALGQLYDTASCAQAGSGCSCSITDTFTVNDSTSYVAAGGVITVGGGTRTYAYCRTGNSLVYRETTMPMTEPGTLTLTLQ
jgi:hypothetical protein